MARKGKSTVEFTILGETASKANSRKLVYFGKRPAFIKSDKARAYVKDFERQCPKLSPLLEGDLSITLHIWYKSRRPDLDDSLILDCMQGFIYLNDRQVKERHVYWHLDKENPRSKISVSEFHPVPDNGISQGPKKKQ